MAGEPGQFEPPSDDSEEPLELIEAEVVPPEESGSEDAHVEGFAFAAFEFTSPLPPPSILKAYAEILPDAPERMMGQSEEESQHRRSMESIAMSSSAKGFEEEASRAKLGLWLGSAVAALALSVGLTLVVVGETTAGATLTGVDVAILATVFVRGSQARRRGNGS